MELKIIVLYLKKDSLITIPISLLRLLKEYKLNYKNLRYIIKMFFITINTLKVGVVINN